MKVIDKKRVDRLRAEVKELELNVLGFQQDIDKAYARLKDFTLSDNKTKEALDFMQKCKTEIRAAERKIKLREEKISNLLA